MVKPIKPSEAVKAKIDSLPDGVVEVFNQLIVENMTNGGTATILQKTAVDRIVEKMQCDRQEVFNKHWLDVEELYRQAGWSVKFDKPGYNEDYEAYFIFNKK